MTMKLYSYRYNGLVRGFQTFFADHPPYRRAAVVYTDRVYNYFALGNRLLYRDLGPRMDISWKLLEADRK